MWSFPNIDPIAFQVGPLAVRWYGLMYLFGFVGGYFVARWLGRKRGSALGNEELMEFISYVAIGVVLGGRLGYVIFYNLPYYLAYPLQLFAVWQGGMSFHGGLLGAMLGGWWYLHHKGLPFYPAADCISAAAPLGLGLGRLGNFINGELYGRVTDVPWGMVFPGGGPLPRHPSQLYEAFLEGAVLLAVLLWLGTRGPDARRRDLGVHRRLRRHPVPGRIRPRTRRPSGACVGIVPGAVSQCGDDRGGRGVLLDTPAAFSEPGPLNPAATVRMSVIRPSRRSSL